MQALAMVVFWWSVAAFLFAYIGYPMLIYLFGLVVRRQRRGRGNSEDYLPSVSLLISAYNEERGIRRKIENSLLLRYPSGKLEVVVLSESKDGTNQIVREYADRGIVLYEFSGREGKSALIHKVVPRAKGDVLVFSDANCSYERDAILKLARGFTDDSVGCVCGHLKYVNPTETAAGEAEGLYWRYECLVKKLESKLHALVGANGSIYAIRKKLYEPLSDDRGDDFELPIQVRLKGYGAVFEVGAVSVEVASEQFQDEFRRRVRIIAWNLESALIFIRRSFWPPSRWLLLFQLLGHKLLRWLLPMFLILALLSNLTLWNVRLYQVALLAQAGFYILAAYGFVRERRNKPLGWLPRSAAYFAVINIASLVGICKFLVRGQRTTWEKVRT